MNFYPLHQISFKLVLLVVQILVLDLGLDSLIEQVHLLDFLLLNHRGSFLCHGDVFNQRAAQLLELCAKVGSFCRREWDWREVVSFLWVLLLVKTRISIVVVILVVVIKLDNRLAVDHFLWILLFAIVNLQVSKLISVSIQLPEIDWILFFFCDKVILVCRSFEFFLVVR